MKKAISLMLALVLCLSLCYGLSACGSNTKDDIKQALIEYEREKTAAEKKQKLLDDIEEAQKDWEEAYNRYLNGN